MDDHRHNKYLTPHTKNRLKIYVLEIMLTSHIITMLNTKATNHHPIVNYYDGWVRWFVGVVRRIAIV